MAGGVSQGPARGLRRSRGRAATNLLTSYLTVPAPRLFRQRVRDIHRRLVVSLPPAYKPSVAYAGLVDLNDRQPGKPRNHTVSRISGINDLGINRDVRAST